MFLILATITISSLHFRRRFSVNFTGSTGQILEQDSEDDRNKEAR
jgi:hypothetical protein